MAIHNPADLYNGAAQVVNTQPYIAFASNMLARKQAKEDALDNYYRDLNKSVNPVGVRNQDMPGFYKRSQELQNFWQQNRDKIKNPRLDNGAAQTEYEQRFQDARGYVNQSKTEEQRKKPFVDMLVDPDKRERITDKMLYDVHLHDLPLDDPNRKSFDPANETFNPKPFETTDWQNYYKNVASDIKPDKNEITLAADPNDKFSQIETTTSKYSPDKLKAIGDGAREDYLNSNRLQYSFDKSHPFKDWKQEHPEQFQTLRDVYKQAYGNNAEIKDDSDLHAAIVLQKKVEPTSAAKRVENYGARLSAQEDKERRMEAIRHANAKDLVQYRKQFGGDGDNQGLWIDNYVDKKIDEATDNNQKIGNNWVKTKRIELDPVLEKALVVNGTTADFITMLPDGRIRYGLYERTTNPTTKQQEIKKTGNTYAIDPESTRTISKDGLKLALGKQSGVKQMNKEMASKSSSTKPTKSKPVTKVEDLRSKYNY
jgi:hypothetical protein